MMIIVLRVDSADGRQEREEKKREKVQQNECILDKKKPKILYRMILVSFCFLVSIVPREKKFSKAPKRERRKISVSKEL